MSLLRFLGLSRADEPTAEIDAIRRIAQELQQLEPARARYVAAFAYLLGRLAHVDQHVSPAETRVMERVLSEHAGVSGAEAVLLVEIARQQHLLFPSVEDFIVARAFADLATYEQRLALVDSLFAVSAADRNITLVEDNEIRRITRELRVEHGDYIRLKSAYRSDLAVLKEAEEDEEGRP